MKRTPARRSSLFLLECIIAILFFILTAAVCVCLFAKSYRLSKDSEDLTMAVHISSSYMEEFRSGETFPAQTLIYYDENWTPCSEDDAVHVFQITMSREADIIHGHFQMDEIFESSLDKYVGGAKS